MESPEKVLSMWGERRERGREGERREMGRGGGEEGEGERGKGERGKGGEGGRKNLIFELFFLTCI